MMRVMRWLSMMVLLSVGFVSFLNASPCDADIEQFCGDRQAGAGRVWLCLQQNKDQLSYQCREWAKKMERVLQKIGTACSNDAATYCKDVKPGYGRVLNCLKSNLDKLEAGCRDALQEPQN